MAYNDELGITHLGMDDNSNLGVILDTLVGQLKAMVVPQFPSAAALSIAYPTLSQAPKTVVVAGEIQQYNATLNKFVPIGGGRAWQNKLGVKTGGNSGAPAQVSVNFDGPPGRYLVVGHMAITNQDAGATQIASPEVRFDGVSSGTTPMTMTGGRTEQFTRMWFFDVTTSGPHGAQVVCTPTTNAIWIETNSSVVALYLGSLG